VARLTGKEPFITVDALKMAKYRMFFSSAKAERELGYSARPYREALIDALDWFRMADIWHDRCDTPDASVTGDLAGAAAGRGSSG